ncbi:DISARM system phospholipase D-like protein DrmC [Micromonospora sp. WMMD754]|uniref:DISARM system phospholipase D-like protein DrmC n=1 Tax=Micromonospora sp. WMMD754 TaxID=3404114 RepID=UPI003BF5B2B3
MKELVEAVVAVGRASPHQQVLVALTDALAPRATADQLALGALRAVAARTPAIRAEVDQLFRAWRDSTAVTGMAVAGMLASAYEAATAERATLRVEPVVTGPQSRHVPLRATRQAFESVAVAARHELLVLTYSAHTDPRIMATLGAAVERGVRVRVLVETTRAEGGTLHTPALNALGDLRAEFYVWDPGRRPRLGSPPSMHAKGIVADRHSAFLTSANLSGHAFDANVELGVRIVGGDVPARLRDHFAALIADAVFVPVTPNPN